MARRDANLRMIAGAFYMAAVAVVAYARQQTRQYLGIKHGDLLSDYCIAVLFYPMALTQIERELGGAVAPAPVVAEEEK